MPFVRHPFFERDLIGIVDHIVDVTDGDIAAARRKLDEVDDLIQKIAENPKSGARLSGKLDGWLMRHGGAGHRLTIVFRPNLDAGQIYLALVAFGGRDWMRLAANTLKNIKLSWVISRLSQRRQDHPRHCRHLSSRPRRV